MTAGLVFSLLCGWVAGGLANLAADILPHVRNGPASCNRPPWTHYLLPARQGSMPSNQDCVRLNMLRTYLVQITTACMFAGVWLFLRDHAESATVGLTWLYGWFLLVILVIDFEHRRVLNIMLAPAAVLLVLFSFGPHTPGVASAAIGGLVGFGVFLLLYVIGRGKLGAGDVKFAGVIGLMIGYPSIWTAIVVGVMLGGAAALLLLASRRATRKSHMAYAPYLAMGAFVALLSALGA